MSKIATATQMIAHYNAQDAEAYVMLHERVFRSATAEPFEVMSIYSFEGDKVSRVEFVR